MCIVVTGWVRQVRCSASFKRGVVAFPVHERTGLPLAGRDLVATYPLRLPSSGGPFSPRQIVFGDTPPFPQIPDFKRPSLAPDSLSRRFCPCAVDISATHAAAPVFVRSQHRMRRLVPARRDTSANGIPVLARTPDLFRPRSNGGSHGEACPPDSPPEKGRAMRLG